MKPNIGITDKNLKGVTTLLTKVLANQHVLYIKTRNFHWNVAGDSFMEYHLLFEGQYTELETAIDEVAERINKLGAVTMGSMKDFLATATLKESTAKTRDGKAMVKELLADHEAAVRELREDIDKCEDDFKDKGTADFLTGLMQAHETIAWKLRRYMP